MADCIALTILLLLAPAVHAAAPVTAGALAADQQNVWVGSQQGLHVHTWPDLELRNVIATSLVNLHDIAFSPDGTRVLIAGGTPGESGTVEVLNVAKQVIEQSFHNHDDLVYRVAWSRDGRRWVTASADGTCHVYEDGALGPTRTFAGHSRPVLAVCFLPESSMVVSAGSDQTLQVWDAASGDLVRTLDNHVGSVYDVAARPMQPAGSLPLLASASADGTVRFWQPTIGRMVRFIRMESHPRVIQWTSNGGRLLVGCNDGRIRSMDPTTLETTTYDKPRIRGPIHALVVGPDGRFLAAGGGETPMVTGAWGGER
jgi:WD40 repeat protein